jgi:hypothetical protein
VKIFEDDTLLMERFPCECLFPGHVLDISVELNENELVECSFDLYMDGKAPLKYRLKQIWKLLQGKDGCIADFLLRPEDIDDMIELLKKAITK